MPNVKWTQDIYTLDRFNRCLIKCPHCNVFHYDCAYADKSRHTATIQKTFMNLKIDVYEVVCPSCGEKFSLRANQKQFNGQYETVYMSVPLEQKKSVVPLLPA